MADELVTLICPPGAADAPMSHGAVGYRAYLADHRDPQSVWLVDVPREAAPYFLKAGFRLFDRQ